MKAFYNTFHEQVKKRIEKYNQFHAFGEDSIRYDFAFTASKAFDLTASDIILEQPLPPTQFIPKVETNKDGRGRKKYKPEFDLRIDPTNKLSQGILAEFSYFRCTQISENQPCTKNHGKLLNDMFRLALLKAYTNSDNNPIYSDFSNYKCLVICVTDDEMIDYGFGGRYNTVPISKTYPAIDATFLSTLSKTTFNQVQPMFKDRLNELNLTVNAENEFRREEEATLDLPKWATWIWEVNIELDNKKRSQI